MFSPFAKFISVCWFLDVQGSTYINEHIGGWLHLPLYVLSEKYGLSSHNNSVKVPKVSFPFSNCMSNCLFQDLQGSAYTHEHFGG